MPRDNSNVSDQVKSSTLHSQTTSLGIPWNGGIPRNSMEFPLSQISIPPLIFIHDSNGIPWNSAIPRNSMEFHRNLWNQDSMTSHLQNSREFHRILKSRNIYYLFHGIPWTSQDSVEFHGILWNPQSPLTHTHICICSTI